MKRPSALVVLLLLLSSLLFSQRVLTINDSTNIERINFSKYLAKKADIDNAILDSLILYTPVNQELNNYYKNVYNAEEYIMKGKYEKAAETYQNAFSYIKYPFKKDINFALKCEMNSRKNEDNIKKYIWFLINKNEDKNEFLNDSTYYDLSNWNEIKNMIDTSKSSINIGLAEEFKNILKADQDVRTGNRSDSALRQINIIDSVNYYKIVDIIKKYPDISEELIGTDGLSTMSIIFLHSKYRLDALIKILPSVHSGYIDARLYTNTLLSRSLYFCENLYNISLFGDFNLSANVALFATRHEIFRVYQMPKKEKKIVEPFRKNLYCEDINKQTKKLIWQFRNNGYNDDFFKFHGTNYAIAYEPDFFKHITEKDNLYGNKYKIYYRTKEDKKNINKAMKEYYKNNPKNDTDIKKD